MPAIPAWPPQSTPRLFVEDRLADGAIVRLDGGPAHYLLNVLRVKPGAPVKLCDNQTGEWLAEVADTAKRDVTLRVTALLRPREAVPDPPLNSIPKLYAGELVRPPRTKGPAIQMITKMTEIRYHVLRRATKLNERLPE